VQDPYLNSTSTLVNGANLVISGIATTTAGSIFNSTNTIQIAGNFDNNGTFSGSTGTLTMTGASKTFGGTGTATFYNLTISGSVALTSNVTITNVLTVGSGGTLNAGSYTITLSGTGTPFVHAGATFNNNTGSVSYSGATANIASTTYSNLTLGTGTYTMLAATTVTGTLTVSSGGTLSATSTLTLSGAGTPFVNSGTFTANSSTVSYTSASSVTTAGASYWTLVLGSGTYTLGANTTSTNSFTNGGKLTIGSSYYLYAQNTFDNNGTTTESGIIKHPLTSAKLTDSAGTEVTTYGASDSVYVTVVDSDGNLDINVADTITGSVVTASTYGDYETITLTETGIDTSIFRSSAFPFRLFSNASNNDGQFEVAGNGTLSLAFVDSKDSSDTGSDTAAFINSNLPTGSTGSSGSTSLDTIPPTNTSISIAGGADSTASVNVTLTLGATGASHMTISNDNTFTNSSWETYVTSKSWVLTSGDGVKTVYVKFKDTAGNISTAVYGIISLNSPVAQAVVSVTAPEVVTTPSAVVDESVSTSNSSVVTVEPVASYNFTKNLGIGSVSTEVSELQKVLKDAGFFKFPSITNYFGTVTKNALTAYQKAGSLSATGKLDAATRAFLNGTAVTAVTEKEVVRNSYKFTKYLYIGSSGIEVRNLQQILKNLGYYTYSSITGYFGPATKAAVIKFQKSKDIVPSSGWVGPGTRAALNNL
jgi:peptidoglycan hydrolase-like protein with peptidoglycan-binding domain